jgi:microcompartment protein CcmL/EutN
VDAGAAKVGAKGLLVNKVVIANPRPEVLRDLI